MSEIEDAIDAAAEWLDLDGVEGVGEGRDAGSACLVVLVSCAPESLRDRIPERFRGFRVALRSTGELEAP